MFAGVSVFECKRGGEKRKGGMTMVLVRIENEEKRVEGKREERRKKKRGGRRERKIEKSTTKEQKREYEVLFFFSCGKQSKGSDKEHAMINKQQQPSQPGGWRTYLFSF